MNVQQKSDWPKDPVCGMKVDPACEPSAPTHYHNGTVYYFCCEGCASKFEAAPDHYLENKPRQSVPRPKKQMSPRFLWNYQSVPMWLPVAKATGTQTAMPRAYFWPLVVDSRTGYSRTAIPHNSVTSAGALIGALVVA